MSMKVIFMDKKTLTLESVPSVAQIQRKHNGKNITSVPGSKLNGLKGS